MNKQTKNSKKTPKKRISLFIYYTLMISQKKKKKRERVMNSHLGRYGFHLGKTVGIPAKAIPINPEAMQKGKTFGATVPPLTNLAISTQTKAVGTANTSPGTS